jgi:hypothetical protein
MFRGFQTFGVAMSSISATSNSNYLTPQQLLQDELQQEISSGAISSSDGNALSSALNDIGSALQSGSTDGAAAAGNTSPGDIQSKVNSLIANEVSSGKLTQQQATELQGLFQNAFGGNGSGNSQSSQNAIQAGALSAVGPVGAVSGSGASGGGSGTGGVHHGHGGGHGGHGGSGNSSSSNTASSSSDASSANQILQQFLQSLQSSSSSASTYTASGSTTAVSDGSSLSSFLINYQS